MFVTRALPKFAAIIFDIFAGSGAEKGLQSKFLYMTLLCLPPYKTGTDVSGLDDEIKAGPFSQFTVVSVVLSRLLEVDSKAAFWGSSSKNRATNI